MNVEILGRYGKLIVFSGLWLCKTHLGGCSTSYWEHIHVNFIVCFSVPGESWYFLEGMIFEEFSLDITYDKNAKFHGKIASYWISELQFCFCKAKDRSFIKLVLKFDDKSFIFRRVRLYQRHHGVHTLLTSICTFRRKWYFYSTGIASDVRYCSTTSM